MYTSNNYQDQQWRRIELGFRFSHSNYLSMHNVTINFWRGNNRNPRYPQSVVFNHFFQTSTQAVLKTQLSELQLHVSKMSCGFILACVVFTMTLLIGVNDAVVLSMKEFTAPVTKCFDYNDQSYLDWFPGVSRFKDFVVFL